MSGLSGVTQSADSIRTDYLKLLVTQLQCQNPLEPMKNEEMATQLAQLSELDQLESMNGTFEKVLLAQQLTQATAMIGKEVSYFVEGEDAARTGRVDRVDYADGEIRLMVDGSAVGLGDIVSISN